MSQSLRSFILNVLQTDIDQIQSEKAIKIDSILPTDQSNASELIDIIIEFINSIRPYVDIEKLSLQNNNITELPVNFFYSFKNLKFLNLHNNNLNILPDEIGLLERLEILDISSNSFMILPSSISNLKKLSALSLKNNKFKYLPPVIGDLNNLSLLEISENPLMLPSTEFIKSLQKNNDLDWVSELKVYIKDISSVLESKINDLSDDFFPDRNRNISHTISRSKSISETRSKASKAARRMGLIIKKAEEATGSTSHEVDENVVNKFDEYPSTILPKSASAAETTFGIIPPPPPQLVPSISTTTVSTVPNSRPVSPIPNSNGAATSNSNPATLSRPSSRNRSRSNTLKEIDRILGKNDNVDTEHKSGAYFRRLSTLQELPNDELSSSSSRNTSVPSSASISNQTTSRRDVASYKRTISKDQQISEEDVSTPLTISHERSTSGNSFPKNNLTVKKPLIESSDIIKVSRKVLFSFSELHSSVRRFTGFCVDKKITMKMVSFLYSTKSNIDSLVENLEIMEESGNNMDQILESLSSSISSFKSIMVLLSENFSKFVVKIDVCFIRMLYLTLYGSFNELLNAYNILSSAKTSQAIPVQAMSNITNGNPEIKQKSTNANDLDEMDEKLYKSIGIAITNAEEVFAELSNVVSKSASNAAFSSSIRNKVKDLSSVCVISMDITKRLKIKLITIRNNPSQPTRKSFWDDINLFLKAVIQTFSAVKVIMKDLPALNEIRASMATLTKSTKDVTIMLDVSSYRSMTSDSSIPSNQLPSLTSIPSVSNLFTPLSAHPSQQSYNLPLVHSNQGNGSFTPSNSHGLSSVRPPVMGATNAFSVHLENSASESSPLASPPLANMDIGNPGPFTAPANSSGHYFERNGMNPFDGLIMAVNNGERENANKKYDN